MIEIILTVAAAWIATTTLLAWALVHASNQNK